MSCLYRLRTHVTKQLGSWGLAVFTVSLAAWCLGNQASQATPITFAFDTQISDVRYTVPFNMSLPFSLQVGDTINGEFTFDSSRIVQTSIINGSADESFNLQFGINGKVASSSEYTVDVVDNAAIADYPFGGPVDIVDVGCGSPTLCAPILNNLPGGDPFRLMVGMELIGDKSILPTSTIDQNPDTWNQFLLQRSLRLTFDDLHGSTALLECSVGTFRATPEPCCLILAALASIPVFIFASAPKRNRHGQAVRRLLNDRDNRGSKT